ARSHRYGDPREPPSFPTRRSSDLGVLDRDGEGPFLCAAGRGTVGVVVVGGAGAAGGEAEGQGPGGDDPDVTLHAESPPESLFRRSEEHTSELQSRENLVCRLLLEK